MEKLKIGGVSPKEELIQKYGNCWNFGRTEVQHDRI